MAPELHLLDGSLGPDALQCSSSIRPGGDTNALIEVTLANFECGANIPKEAQQATSIRVVVQQDALTGLSFNIVAHRITEGDGRHNGSAERFETVSSGNEQCWLEWSCENSDSYEDRD
jgi:hypothetical protein